MAKTAPIQTGFVAGRLGPRMAGRTDLARYPFGCKTLNNFIPTVQGPVVKRSGTKFVKACETESEGSRLIPFEFSRDQAYVLEFFDNGIRFMRDSGAVLESTVAISGNPTVAANCQITTGAAHGYATGDQVYVSGSSMAMINSQYFTITVTGATTFTIGVDTTGESTSGGPGTVARTYEIRNGVASNSIPWNYDELDQLAFAQSADVMYLAHPLYPPHKLSRTNDTSWTCVELDAQWPPFRDENSDDTITVYVNAVSGATVTVQASADIFTSDMVGGYIAIGELIEIKHPKWVAGSAMNYGAPGVNDTCYYGPNVYDIDAVNGAGVCGNIPPTHETGVEMDRPTNGFEWEFLNRGWGYGKIETFTDANTIVIDVDNYGIRFPASVNGAGNATAKWKISAFNAEYGYPSAVAIFEDRLWFGGTEKDPQTFWGSKTNLFDDFEPVNGEADSAVQFTLSSNKINPIQWLSGEDQLIIGTKGGEYTASGENNEAITPDNIKVIKRSGFGAAANVQPVYVDSAIIMAQRNGKRVHELIYDFNTDRYQGADLTELSDDITGTGVKSITYQSSPFRQVLALTNEKDLIAMTYVRDQEVKAWTKYVIGAAGGGVGDVESIAVIPHPDGDEDQVWMIVKRTLVGQTKRWIEYLEKPFEEGDAIADAYFVDGGSTYSGAATTTVNGFLHYPYLSAIVYSTGTATGVVTVSTKGKITVPSTTKVHIGLAYEAELETMDFEMGDQRNSSQGERGRSVAAVFRVNNMGTGMEYGQSLSGTLDAYDVTAGTLYTGDTPEFTLPGGFSRSRTVAFQHVDPVPCTLVAIMPKLSVEGS